MSFHQTLPPSMLNGCPTARPVLGSIISSLNSAACSLSWHVGTLSLACLHGFCSHPPSSQDLPGPWCTHEGLHHLFGGSPCVSTVQYRITLRPFLYSLSLQCVELLKALGGLQFALYSL